MTERESFTDSRVSVIIPAMNEARTIAGAVAGARAIGSNCEVIVIVNGSTDATAELARAAGARVAVYAEPLGHDAGRRAGAEMAGGDILLFTDGDLVLAASDLLPYVRAVEQGADIALNRYSGPGNTVRPHPVVLSKYGLNMLLQRPDLEGCSMTAVPHAISRKALQMLGAGLLARPPLAHARAVVEGLRMEAPHRVEVGKLNAPRRKREGEDPLTRLIVEDHLEAVSYVLRARGARAGYTDGTRRRGMVRE